MKKLLCSVLLVCGLVSAAFAAYPERPVTIICGPAAGGGTDRVLRGLASELQKILGQTFIVENKPGASHSLSHVTVAKSAPDGYTLVGSIFELSQYHWMGISPVSYKDFENVACMNLEPSCVTVRADSPFKTLKELLDYAKAHPGELTMGSSPASVWNLARVALCDAAGLSPKDILLIPTNGAAQAIVELMGGHINVVFNGFSEVKSQYKSGEFRVLAVLSDERNPDCPEIPTAKELGYDVAAFTFRGISAPKGTPKEVVATLEKAIKQACESESFKEFMGKLGAPVYYLDSEGYTALLKKTDESIEHLLKLAGLVH
ncbi:MAG: tripartite tricarboxylate transporter substrate binding protein [Pyramidobacter sp.]|nr:tripartite tricarboxylate transporter substrate binding protein [Pyramidobacter sp.]